jgi:hypothetical protein
VSLKILYVWCFATCRANLINQNILFYYRLYITCYICILISCLTFYRHYLNLYYMYYLVTLSRQIQNHRKHTHTRIALLFVGLNNTCWCSRYLYLPLNHCISICDNTVHVWWRDVGDLQDMVAATWNYEWSQFWDILYIYTYTVLSSGDIALSTA